MWDFAKIAAAGRQTAAAIAADSQPQGGVRKKLDELCKKKRKQMKKKNDACIRYVSDLSDITKQVTIYNQVFFSLETMKHSQRIDYWKNML